jgi:hypothetical protein
VLQTRAQNRLMEVHFQRKLFSPVQDSALTVAVLCGDHNAY